VRRRQRRWDDARLWGHSALPDEGTVPGTDTQVYPETEMMVREIGRYVQAIADRKDAAGGAPGTGPKLRGSTFRNPRSQS
jgi:hypothetical protein